MHLRILSGVVIMAIFISSLIYAIPSFNIIISLIGLIMMYEWYLMVRPLYYYLLLGIIIITPSIISLIILNNEGYKWLIFSFFIMIWSVDTCAMIAGKMIGGAKLAPYISPNKTWSGFVIGIFFSAVITMTFMNLVGNNYDQYIKLLFQKKVLFGIIILSIFAQLSDLFISYFKRKFGIKDSGNIIPGHGGMLDRFDSIILTAPILIFMVYYL